MRKSGAVAPPPPGGAGAGGGGRSEDCSKDTARASLGWSPNLEETRQKDFVRANQRARRLRRELTTSEKKLRRLLRDEPNVHFRKQVAVNEYVYDFAEFGTRLLIELDGGVHDLPENAVRDAAKTLNAKRAGFNLLRLTNDDVWTRPDWVLDQIRVYLKAPHPLPPPRQGAGEMEEQQ